MEFESPSSQKMYTLLTGLHHASAKLGNQKHDSACNASLSAETFSDIASAVKRCNLLVHLLMCGCMLTLYHVTRQCMRLTQHDIGFGDSSFKMVQNDTLVCLQRHVAWVGGRLLHS